MGGRLASLQTQEQVAIPGRGHWRRESSCWFSILFCFVFRGKTARPAVRGSGQHFGAGPAAPPPTTQSRSPGSGSRGSARSSADLPPGGVKDHRARASVCASHSPKAGGTGEEHEGDGQPRPGGMGVWTRPLPQRTPSFLYSVCDCGSLGNSSSCQRDTFEQSRATYRAPFKDQKSKPWGQKVVHPRL